MGSAYGYFGKADISYEYYDNTVANPTVSNVEEAKDKYIEGGCQAIVALGGGSSMDCAKAKRSQSGKTESAGK